MAGAVSHVGGITQLPMNAGHDFSMSFPGLMRLRLKTLRSTKQKEKQKGPPILSAFNILQHEFNILEQL